jgi:transcriptional regulator with XRE-family HTH domain
MRKRDPILRALGQTVAKYRQEKELSQEALAERAGLNRTYLSDIERGVRNPGIRNVARLAKALGVSTARLVEELDR